MMRSTRKPLAALALLGAACAGPQQPSGSGVSNRPAAVAPAAREAEPTAAEAGESRTEDFQTKDAALAGPLARLGADRFGCQGVGMNVSRSNEGAVYVGQRCRPSQPELVDEYRTGPCASEQPACFDAVLIIGTPPEDFAQLPTTRQVMLLGGETGAPVLVLRRPAACSLQKWPAEVASLNCQFPRGELFAALASALPEGVRVPDNSPVALLLPHPSDASVARSVRLDMQFPAAVQQLQAGIEREVALNAEIAQCKAGDEKVCETLRHIDDPQAQAAGEAGALKLREQACLAGKAEVCAEAASLLPAAEKHSPRRQRLLKVACDAGDQQTCVELAQSMDTGVVDPVTLRRIIHMMDIACAKGVARACQSLGRRYRQGLQVNRNEVKARHYYIRGCRLGDEACCTAAKQGQ